MQLRKRQREEKKQENEEKNKNLQEFSIDELYAVFGYGDEQIYIPFRCCNIYHPSGMVTIAERALIGIKRPYYCVYSPLDQITLYKSNTTKVRKPVSFSATIYTNDEKRVNVPLSNCMLLAPYFDGQKFTCKLDELVLVHEPGGVTFMFKDLFFHEECTPITYTVLKKNKKPVEPVVNEIVRTSSVSTTNPLHTMYT